MKRTTTSRAPGPDMMSSEELAELAASVRQAFVEGSLTLAQICGLTADELRALRREAERRRRRGQLRRAAALYGLLAACDPYEARSWDRLGDLQRKLRDPVTALACFQTALLVGGDATQLAAKLTACVRQLERTHGGEPKSVTRSAVVHS